MVAFIGPSFVQALVRAALKIVHLRRLSECYNLPKQPRHLKMLNKSRCYELPN